MGIMCAEMNRKPEKLWGRELARMEVNVFHASFLLAARHVVPTGRG